MMDEFGLIADLFAPLAQGYPGAFGLLDDAALVAAEPGKEIVVTVDAVVAGIHFLADDPADLVARKLVRVNLSDLAAKGAEPFAVLLAAAFPQDVGAAWLRLFADGLGKDVRRYRIALIGGDTVATPGPLTLSLTALGRVAAGGMLRRAGARAGDDLWVSGTLGDGALGLKAARGQLPGLAAGDLAALAERYRLPRPRVDLGPRLVGLAGACMDVSDGLVQDLGHMCRASGVGAAVDCTLLPLSPAARNALAADDSLLACVLAGGDDYELLFTAPPAARAAVEAAAAESGVAVGRIGGIEVQPGVRVVDGAGRALAPAATGWRHFRAGTEGGGGE